MSKYASLLFKAEEYHHIGPFRFPIYHDLVPGEARGMEKIGRKQSKHTYQSIKLAKRIAKDRGVTVKEAIEALSDSTEDSAADVVMEYTDEMEALQADTIGAFEQQIEFVTLFMQYRGEACTDKKHPTTWQQLSDWTQEDTELMPSALMSEIFTFILWERDGWPKTSPEDAEGNAPEEPTTEAPPTSTTSSDPASSTSSPPSPTGT